MLVKCPKNEENFSKFLYHQQNKINALKLLFKINKLNIFLNYSKFKPKGFTVGKRHIELNK